MASSTVATVDEQSERTRLEELVGRAMPIARVADAIASRTVNKVKGVALLGSLAALWLTYVCATTFEVSLTAALALLVPLLIPSLVLWKIYGTLRDVVGLPERLIATTDRLFGKFSEYRRAYAERNTTSAVKTKPKFKDLWRTAATVLELRSLGNEGRELWQTMSGAIVMGTPLFAIVLFATMIICLLLTLIAAIVGLVVMF
jgi:hypothetical protein